MPRAAHSLSLTASAHAHLPAPSAVQTSRDPVPLGTAADLAAARHFVCTANRRFYAKQGGDLGRWAARWFARRQKHYQAVLSGTEVSHVE